MERIISVGVDVDDVLVVYGQDILALHNRLAGTNFQFSDFVHYDLSDVVGISPEQESQLIMEFARENQAKPLQDAYDVLLRLNKTGNYQFVILTARYTQNQQSTRYCIGSLYPNIFQSVFFSADCPPSDLIRKKTQVCLKEKIDILIDDRFKNVKDCLNHNIAGVLFGDYPWNNSAEVSKLPYVAKSWLELETLLPTIEL